VNKVAGYDMAASHQIMAIHSISLTQSSEFAAQGALFWGLIGGKRGERRNGFDISNRGIKS
jgi:hypothetical protein